MTLISQKNILIVGLGLLGGSYAMGLKKKGFQISAITKNQTDIEYAHKKGIIDEGTTEIDEDMISKADIAVFALYPHTFVEWIKQFGGLFKEGTVITDVTGVKTCIVNEIQDHLPKGVEFISAHPMAGKEVGGVQNADDRIFQGANYIVVPTERNSEEAITVCKQLGYLLGFNDVSIITPEKHDEMIAFLSQLTHCIAVSLMCSSDDPDLVRYTGDSFRDLTRIAKINDEMWSELFLSNKSWLLKEMDRYKESFDKLYDYIKNDDVDGMRAMMQLSTSRRKLFDK